MNWQRSEPAPAIVVHPPAAASLDEAHAAIEQWEHYSGKQLDSPQRLAVELMLAEDASHRWAARTTGRAESRQNGKGDEVEVVEAWGLTQRGEAIVHTAHEIPTAKSAHLRLVAHFEGHRDLRRKVGKFRYANGDQSIEMAGDSGGIIVYRTRTAGGGRGLDDISRLVIDEAQHAQPEQLASSTPILAANPNPQMNFTGSAGIFNRSDWWWELRKRALLAVRDGNAGQFAWLEHSAERVEVNRDDRIVSTPPDPTDVDAWEVANPTLGVRIEREFLAEQLATLGADLFAREHLGVWDPYNDGEGGLIPFDAWSDLTLKAAPDKVLTPQYGLSVSLDQSHAAVGSAGRLADGSLYVDNIEWRKGTNWIVANCKERYDRKRLPVRIDPSSSAGPWIKLLIDAGVEVVEVPAREYQQGCGALYAAVLNGELRHLVNAALDRSVAAADRRDVGNEGAWVWAHPASVDISPLTAATLALTGVTDRQRKPALENVY